MISTIKKPYYGWWIVGSAIVCQFTSMSLGQAVVGVFLRPVIDELGWQVWQFTLGSSLAFGLGAFSGIIAGQIVDRHGPRPLFLVGAIVTAICFYGLSRQSNLWIFLLLYLISGTLGWNLFGPMIVNATVSKWFIIKRGWALAIGSIGISLGGLITPVTMTAIVDNVGWRNGYLVLAIFALVVVMPLAFVMRRTPEDYGLVPDGNLQPVASSENTVPSVTETRSLTRKEALRTTSFWLIVAGFGFNMAALTSVLVHAIPFATEAGFTRSVAAFGLAINGIGNLSSKALWGYTLQRIQPRRLVVIAYSFSSAGVGLMLVAAATGEQALLFLGFFFYGFGFGGTIPLSEFIWAKYFGRAHLGAIRGIGFPITILGTAPLPVLVGLWFDVTQTYQPAFIAIIAIYLTGATLVWSSREPS